MLSSADTEYETSSAKCGVNDEKLFMCRSGGGGFCERPRWRSEVAKPISWRFASSLLGSLPGLASHSSSHKSAIPIYDILDTQYLSLIHI